LGRNIEETLRIIDAWKYYQQYGEVCPANWNKGDEAMKPTQEGVEKYLSNISKPAS
jgi:peroxiredoxin (alkyl hydroperoxide reductase subunit C)